MKLAIRYLFLATFLTISLFNLNASAQEPLENPSITNGSALWFENCAPCHGTTGLGDGPTAAALEFPPANFADPELAKNRIPAEMFSVAKDGRMDKFMPPWGNQMDQQQIWDVIAYAQNLALSPAELSAGAEVFAESCAQCHNADGANPIFDLTQANALVNVSPQTIFNSLRADAENHAVAQDLNNEALWNSINYARTLSWEMPVLDGVLSGQAINQSTGEAAGNIALTLYVLSPSGQPIQTYNATADEQGRFTFENLNRDHNLAYALEGIYQDISYFSPEPAVFLPDQTEITLDALVYNTTPSPENISLGSLHRIMEFAPGLVSIADVYVFDNTGSETYVGQTGIDGLPETVEVTLPDGAINIQFRGGTVRQTERNTYLDSQSVIPGKGSYDLIVTYEVPIEGDELSLEVPLFYDTAEVNVLISAQGAGISSPQLTSQGIETIQNRNFERLLGSNLPAESVFEMSLSQLDSLEFQTAASGVTELPDASPTAVNQPQTVVRWLALGLGALAIGFAILFAERRKPAKASAPTLNAEKTRLLLLLRELEALYRAGKIDQTAYEQIKNQNWALLKEVLLEERR